MIQSLNAVQKASPKELSYNIRQYMSYEITECALMNHIKEGRTFLVLMSFCGGTPNSDQYTQIRGRTVLPLFRRLHRLYFGW